MRELTADLIHGRVVSMTDVLSKSAESALATFRHHDGLARLNARKAEAAMDLFLSLLSQDGDGVGVSRVPNCVVVWRRWLAENFLCAPSRE